MEFASKGRNFCFRLTAKGPAFRFGGVTYSVIFLLPHRSSFDADKGRSQLVAMSFDRNRKGERTAEQTKYLAQNFVVFNAYPDQSSKKE